MRTAQVYTKPLEFVRGLNFDVYNRARDQKKTLTAMLEADEGLSSGQYNDGMDAFERLLMLSDIRVASDAETGIIASTGGALLDSERAKVLLPELLSRTYRKVAAAKTRSPYAVADSTPGSIERPYADVLVARTDLQIAPAIPLTEVVTQITMNVGRDYRATYIKNDPAQQHKVRVGEGAPLPKAKLKTAPNVVTMYKFGRSLEITYEDMRSMRIDRLLIHIQKIAAQSQVDEVNSAVDTIVNGDGNTDTAAQVVTQSSLDGLSVDGKLHFAGWQAFKKLFKSPYMLTTALMQPNVATMLETLNVGSANLPMIVYAEQSKSVGNITPINQTGDGVRYGWLDGAPALKIVGFDKRYELEHVIEVGSDIQEIMRWINRQTEELTMSINEGDAVVDPSAALILDINA